MLSNKKKLTILFDLDGTLIDHSDAIYDSYTYAQEQMGVEPKSKPFILKTIGACIIETFTELVGQEKAETAYQHFQDRFKDCMIDKVKPLPGSHWILEGLHKQNHMLTLFTGKDGKNARALCAHLNFTDWFTHIFGRNDSPFNKPHKGFTRFAVEQTASSPGNMILIGDTIHDVEAAKHENIPCYLVATGSMSREELIAHNVPESHIFDSLYELGQKLFGLSVA